MHFFMKKEYLIYLISRVFFLPVSFFQIFWPINDVGMFEPDWKKNKTSEEKV